MENKTWTAAAIARQLMALVEQRGTPNDFQLHEVAGSVGSKVDILSIARVARYQALAVNADLAAQGLQATYCVRLHDRPALIQVRRIAARPVRTAGAGSTSQRVGRLVVRQQGAGQTTWSFVDGSLDALSAGQYEVFVRLAPPTREVLQEHPQDERARRDAERVAGDASIGDA